MKKRTLDEDEAVSDTGRELSDGVLLNRSFEPVNIENSTQN